MDIDVKVEEIKFPQELQKYIQLVKDEIDVDMSKSIPPWKQHTVHIKLKNTNSGFANMLRKVIRGELTIYGLKIDWEAVDKNDDYILVDDLDIQLGSIKLWQSDLKEPEKIKFNLNIKNETIDMMDVYSHDIDDGGLGIIPPNIPICKLRPGKYIKLKPYIVKGISIDNGNVFSAVAGLYYRHEDVPKGYTILNYLPKNFEMGYTTYRNFKDPLEILRNAQKTINERIDKMVELVKLFALENKTQLAENTSAMIWLSDELQVEKKSEEFYFSFMKETDSILGAVHSAIYHNNPKIAYVGCNKIDMKKYGAYIRLNSEKPVEVLLKGFETVKKNIKF